MNLVNASRRIQTNDPLAHVLIGLGLGLALGLVAVGLYPIRSVGSSTALVICGLAIYGLALPASLRSRRFRSELLVLVVRAAIMVPLLWLMGISPALAATAVAFYEVGCLAQWLCRLVVRQGEWKAAMSRAYGGSLGVAMPMGIDLALSLSVSHGSLATILAVLILALFVMLMLTAMLALNYGVRWLLDRTQPAASPAPDGQPAVDRPAADQPSVPRSPGAEG